MDAQIAEVDTAPVRMTDVHRYQIIFNLSPSQAVFLAQLMRDEVVTHAWLAGNEDWNSNKLTIRVAIARWRKKMAAYGVELQTLAGTGYWLDAHAKALVRKANGG